MACKHLPARSGIFKFLGKSCRSYIATPVACRGDTNPASWIEKRHALECSFEKQTFMKTLGAELVHIAPGEVDIQVVANSKLLQQNGFFHAGVTTSIADSAAGYACYTLFEEGSDVLTTELKTNLLKPAQGDKMIARGRIIKVGKTLSVAKADVYCQSSGEEETHVATGLFSLFQVRNYNRVK